MYVPVYPDIDYVRQCLREENGHLFWLHRPTDHFSAEWVWGAWNKKWAGKEAGSAMSSGGVGSKKYRWVIGLSAGQQKFRLLRYTIIWALYYNEWCALLDHENHDQLDDRVDNIRPATQSQNIANAKLAKNNKSGFKGVSWDNKRSGWQVHIYVDGRSMNLGFFIDPQKGHEAYMEAARKYFGVFASNGL